MAPRLLSGGSTPEDSLSAEAVDLLWESLRLGPHHASLMADDDEFGDEAVEEDELDSEEVHTPFSCPVGIQSVPLGMAEAVLDARDWRPRSAHGAGPVGGGLHSGHPRGTRPISPVAALDGATPQWFSSASPAHGSREGVLDVEQVLQALLLQQGLLEDQELAAGPSEFAEGWGAGGVVSPSWRTLREMRRYGPLGELSQDAQTTLLGGTLYAYGGQESLRGHSLENSTSSLAFRGRSASPRRRRPAVWRGESHESSLDSSSMEASSSSAHPGFFPDDPGQVLLGGGGYSLAQMLQLSLDRILQQSQAEPDAARGAPMGRVLGPAAISGAERGDPGLRFSGLSGHAARLQLDGSQPHTARSIRTVSSSVAGPQSPGAVSGASLTEEFMGSSFSSRPGESSLEATEGELRMRSLEAAVLDTPLSGRGSPLVGLAGRHPFGGEEDQDEGIVSVRGFDSPRSWDSPVAAMVRRPPEVPPELPQAAPEPQAPDLLDETSSVWGLGDTARSTTSTVRSDSAQQSGEVALDGLEGVTGMFARLANESLDESVTRSVRRVLQLGAVLTGQRLSEDEVQSLPQVRFDAAEQQNCAICLEAYRRGELLTSLRCGHFFHVDCVARWFQRSSQCPLCRSECLP